MKKFLDKYTKLITVIAATIILAASIVLMAPGCQSYVDDTGQTVTKLSDQTADVLDKASDLAPAVQTTLGIVGVAVPSLAALLGILAGTIGAFTAAYKKYRPQITAEHNKAVTYGNTTKALVFAIEEFKSTNSGDWDDLKSALMYELKDKVGPEYFAIIDALRESYKKE